MVVPRFKKPLSSSLPIPENLWQHATEMSKEEARYIIHDFYESLGIYQSAKEHVRILQKQELRYHIERYLYNSARTFRRRCKEFLDVWTDNFPSGRWVKSFAGFGPIISAGFVALIDIDKAKTVSSVWRYAGFDPSQKKVLPTESLVIIKECQKALGPELTDEHVRWIARKIDRNPDSMLRLCKKRGSFTWWRVDGAIRTPQCDMLLRKVCLSAGNDIINYKNPYQDLYRYRYQYEVNRNTPEVMHKVAERQLERFQYRPTTMAYKAYKQGILPDSHMRNRARNWAVKILLSHYYMVAYYCKYGKRPPDVYALDILKGHRKIHVPNWKVWEKHE